MLEHQAVEILIVEDNEDDAHLALRALKKYHVSNHVLWVKDGEEALDYMFFRGEYANRKRGQNPKLILLDLKMPKVDGMEVLEEVRKHPETRSTPVVMLTSSQEERDITESYNLGVNSYIVKPVDFNKFADSIKEVGFYWVVLNKSTNG
jgi:CheY-like chemotaxis protein